LHAEQFTLYLRRLLDRSAEGRGGRVGVEDTLQDALVRIYHRWPELAGLDGDERDRRLYRCLRDAAADALRQEYGSRARSSPRPRLIAYDFASLEAGEDDRPVRERELTAAVLGGMARDVAGADASGPVLGRAVLVAGLRALSEHEAVVLIAADHLGWDQQRLAERLGVGYSTLRETLYVARKLLSMTIRHAAGIEVDEEAQAQLAAFRAGELKGTDRRAVARHLGRCHACQTLDAQRQGFGHGAAQILVPLPYVLGAHVLVKRSVVKTAPAAGGAGLFAQPGAAKVTATVMGLLIAGGATSAILAAVSEQHGRRPRTPAATMTSRGFPPPGGMRRIEAPAAQRTLRLRKHAHATHHTKTTARRQTKTTTAQQQQAPTITQQQTTTATPPPAQQRRTPSSSSGSGCEFLLWLSLAPSGSPSPPRDRRGALRQLDTSASMPRGRGWC
jgi:DNA-directed RNA polymerase specialized sigma24 family protein